MEAYIILYMYVLYIHVGMYIHMYMYICMRTVCTLRTVHYLFRGALQTCVNSLAAESSLNWRG